MSRRLADIAGLEADYSSIERRIARVAKMKYRAMTESERADEAGYHRVSTFEERWVRHALKVEHRPKVDDGGDAWVLDHMAAVGLPYAARVELNCPHCGHTMMITDRGVNARDAADAVVAKVAAHGVECAG